MIKYMYNIITDVIKIKCILKAIKKLRKLRTKKTKKATKKGKKRVLDWTTYRVKLDS